jgi:hypothetical protein
LIVMGSLRRLLIALPLALVAGAVATAASQSAGTPGDPLQAPDCRAALAALQTEEATADAAWRASAASGARDGAAPSAELQAARRRAARSCLASRTDPPLPPPRSIQAPIVVAPIAPFAPGAPSRPTPAAPTHLPPPVVAERPYAVTTCDPGGCWANDGSRLNRVGPNLWGKRGICTLQGSLLQCP